MEYEGQICRSPMERGSYMLPIMVGCSYNACKFCNLFKHLKFRELPLEQIQAEINRVSSVGGRPKRVFLGDGNAFCTAQERLLTILDMLHKSFNSIQEINMDATVTSILTRTDEELKALFNAGVRHLYLGIECGLDDVLTFMNKDHNLNEAYEAIKRITDAGMIFDAHMMTGICGAGRGLENAAALAKFYNKTKPSRITNFSLFVDKCTPLFNEMESGRFKMATEWENLLEDYELIKAMEGFSVSYDSFHDYIPYRVKGTLPMDKDAMLASLKKAMDTYTEEKEIYALVDHFCCPCNEN